MKVLVQIVDETEDDFGLRSVVIGTGQFQLAAAAIEPIKANTEFKRNLECDRAALEASASLLMALLPELQEIRRKMREGATDEA